MKSDLNKFNFQEVPLNSKINLPNIEKGAYQDVFASSFSSPIEDLLDHCSKKHSGIGNKYENWKTNARSIALQQNIIKYVLKIGKEKKEVENFWNRYETKIESLLKGIKDPKKKKEVKDEFWGLKRSIIGSLATINFFGSQGFQVDYPSIEEDMKKKCDLKFHKSTKEKGEIVLAVQLKSTHLPDLGKDEIQNVVNKLILTNNKELNDKDRKDFDILKQYCALKSNESEEKHIPLFVNMPVSQEVRTGRKRCVDIIKIVNNSGEINSVMQKSLERKWNEKKKDIGFDKI